MPYAAITGWGEGLPPAVLTNADLSTFLETSDEWITSRTGMRERRISHVSAVEMATIASARALACAGLDASDVDLIIYGGCSNEEVVPNSASGVQLALGATRAGAMDLNTACTSFIYGLSTATALIQNGTIRNAVVMCSAASWGDRITPLGTSPMAFPALTKTALEMVNEVRTKLDPHGRSAAGLMAPVFAEARVSAQL